MNKWTNYVISCGKSSCRIFFLRESHVGILSNHIWPKSSLCYNSDFILFYFILRK